MNIVNSLKKLYMALGGEESTVKDVQTAPDMVDALAEVAGSTIELPAVTAEDAGDVLTVGENGKWIKAEPSGGGVEVFEFTVNKSVTDTFVNETITPVGYDSLSAFINANYSKLKDGKSVLKISGAGSSQATANGYVFVYFSHFAQGVIDFAGVIYGQCLISVTINPNTTTAIMTITRVSTT